MFAYVRISFSVNTFFSPTCLSQLDEIMDRGSLLIHQPYCNQTCWILSVLHSSKFQSVTMLPYMKSLATVQLISLFFFFLNSADKKLSFFLQKQMQNTECQLS